MSSSVNITLSYLLWGLGFLGLCGLHRFYLGKPISGLIWFFTFGLFFIGQLVDLFLITDMIKDRNKSLTGTDNISNETTSINQKTSIFSKFFSSKESKKPSLHKLLKAASENENVLSVGQAIMATGLSPDEVQDLLSEALRQGIADIDNEPETGAVRYYFDI